MKMFDSDKVELVKAMINEFWSNGTVSEDSAICLLNSISCVLEFEGKE